MSQEKWYYTDCSVCGEAEDVEQTTITGRRCANCGFEWDIMLPEWQIIVQARDYVRQRLEQEERKAQEEI